MSLRTRRHGCQIITGNIKHLGKSTHVKCQRRLLVFPWLNYETVSKGLWGQLIFPLLLVEKKIYHWFRDKSGVASRCSFLRAEAAEKLLETDARSSLERTLDSSEPSSSSAIWRARGSHHESTTCGREASCLRQISKRKSQLL